MSTDMSAVCSACRRRLLLTAAVAAVDGVIARGRCTCGAALAIIETSGEDGLPVRQVHQAQSRHTRTPNHLARRYRATDLL